MLLCCVHSRCVNASPFSCWHVSAPRVLQVLRRLTDFKPEVVRAILDQKADVTGETDAVERTLQSSRLLDNLASVRLLLESKAPVSRKAWVRTVRSRERLVVGALCCIALL